MGEVAMVTGLFIKGAMEAIVIMTMITVIFMAAIIGDMAKVSKAVMVSVVVAETAMVAFVVAIEADKAVALVADVDEAAMAKTADFVAVIVDKL